MHRHSTHGSIAERGEDECHLGFTKLREIQAAIALMYAAHLYALNAHVHATKRCVWGQMRPTRIEHWLITLYCLYFFPISFLESLRDTDHPEGSGPFEDMPGEWSTGGLPGPLPGGLPGFLFLISGPP